MKKHEDNRISFSYPDELKLVRAKRKWGQYNLEKKGEMLIIIEIRPCELVNSVRRLICNCPFDDSAQGEYFESVTFGGKQGMGHVVTLYDPSHKFIQKRYRYLFPTSRGGLYVEVIGSKDFSIDSYKELLESIRIKNSGFVPSMA